MRETSEATDEVFANVSERASVSRPLKESVEALLLLNDLPHQVEGHVGALGCIADYLVHAAQCAGHAVDFLDMFGALLGVTSFFKTPSLC